MSNTEIQQLNVEAQAAETSEAVNLASGQSAVPDTPDTSGVPEGCEPLGDSQQLAELLYLWAYRMVATLEHMKKIPPGTEIHVDEANKFVLEGDMLEGFKLGLTLAIMEMSSFPLQQGTPNGTHILAEASKTH